MFTADQFDSAATEFRIDSSGAAETGSEMSAGEVVIAAEAAAAVMSGCSFLCGAAAVPSAASAGRAEDIVPVLLPEDLAVGSVDRDDRMPAAVLAREDGEGDRDPA